MILTPPPLPPASPLLLFGKYKSKTEELLRRKIILIPKSISTTLGSKTKTGGGPRDTIILYVESGNAPLVVEVPDGGGVGVGAGARAAVGGGTGAATGGDGLEKEFD
uniref:Uncharacterized protein n=1 Tax=Quercus lobata TaxID=97700 RepID=A0A7N2MQ11_QUELO